MTRLEQQDRRVRLVAGGAVALLAWLSASPVGHAQSTQCLTEGVGCEDTIPDATTGSAPGTVPTTAPSSSGAPGASTVPTAAPSSSVATASPSTVSAGEPVTVRGTGPFGPAQPLQITFDGTVPLGSTQADEAGAYVATATIPPNASRGLHRITVSGQGAQGGTHESVAEITVGLPVTGAVTDIMAVVGVAVLALGLHLVRRSQWSLPVSTSNWASSGERGWRPVERWIRKR